MADKKPIILKTFNNTFSEFLKELCTIFPKNKEIKAYKNSFSLAHDTHPANDIPNTTYQIKNSLKYEF